MENNGPLLIPWHFTVLRGSVFMFRFATVKSPQATDFQIFHLNAGAEFDISASLGGMQKGALYSLSCGQHFSVPTLVYLKTLWTKYDKVCVFLWRPDP